MKYWVWLRETDFKIFELTIDSSSPNPYHYRLIFDLHNSDMLYVGSVYKMDVDYYNSELRNKKCKKYKTIEEAIGDNFDKLL